MAEIAPPLGNKPTILELETMKGIDGNPLNIFKRIAGGEDYTLFGALLLNDKEKVDVKVITMKHRNDSPEIPVKEFAEKWLMKGGPTCTYQHFIDCVREYELNDLADLIRDAVPRKVNPTVDPPVTTRRSLASLMDLLTAFLALIFIILATNHSSLPDSLLQYQVYLHDEYHRDIYPKYTKPSDFLAVNRPEHPINLVLVHKEKQIIETHTHNQQLKFAFHGKVDEIQKQKTPIKTEEIGFTVKTNVHVAAHFVLIEGSAGIGKSTLCWQLCRLWLEGKLQHEWDLMVLVEIRNEDTRKAISIYDLLYHPDDRIRQSIAQEIQKRQGKGLMIIFDGYDELSDDQRNEFSLVQQILSNQALDKATIVVTSRPIATRGLPTKFKEKMDQHIEIAGFNETDIQTYITLACKDNIEMLHSLNSYVSSRPIILSVMYNPLHCKIVTELYIQYWIGEEKLFAPNTLTELYTALVLNLLKRSLPLNQSSSNIEELADLPTHVYNDLMQLAELAARGLESSQYIYDNIPCNTLGLIVSVRQLVDIRPKKAAYMFLHLTLQEYLSALYWSQQPQKQQNKFLHGINFQVIMKAHSLGINYYDRLNATSFHWPHLLFLAGLTELSPFPLQVIMPESDSKKNIVIGPICQLLFEAQSPQKVSDLLSHSRIVVDAFSYKSNTFDWFVIGYCIANSNKKSSWIVRVNSPQYLQLLSNGLHYSNSNISLDLSGLSINMYIYISRSAMCSPAKYSTLFSQLYPFTKAISQLSLVFRSGYEAYSVDESCFHVFQNLSYYCPYLKSLSLEIYESFVLKNPLDIPKETMVTTMLKFSHSSVVLESPNPFKSLSEIRLCNSDCQTDVCPSLKKIFLKINSNITALRFSNVSIDQSCVDGLVRLLKSSLIELLKFNGCAFSNNEFDDLITAIATSELKHLELEDQEIDVKMGNSLARLLIQSKKLEKVTLLEYYSMDCDVSRLLVEAMTHSSVKNLITNEDCRKAVTDIPYPRDRVTFF